MRVMTEVVLTSPDERTSVTVEVAGIEPEQYRQVSDLLGREIDRETRTYVGVANAMKFATELCPKANPADLWVHLIYHQFRTRYRKSDQSWKRVSGQALEHLVIQAYSGRLAPAGIIIRTSVPADAQRLGLIEMGLGSAKTDLIVEGGMGNSILTFAILHCKASIAERLTDDAPASTELIKRGYWSAIVTMDSKMFPPPHGVGIVNGELGHTKAGDKRRYFEVAGQFSACYSFNLRTPESAQTTPSGSRINTLSFSEPQPDVLVRDLIAARDRFQSRA